MTDTIVEPTVEVPEDFDIDIHRHPDRHPDGGIYRRYAAGIRSILDRADLAVGWTLERVQNHRYADVDLEVRFVAGDLVASDTCNPLDRRCATVRGTVAWHVTGGGNLTEQPLYVDEAATIRVLSRSGEGETTFQVRPAELAQIKGRVRDVILRDHLLDTSHELGRWRWA